MTTHDTPAGTAPQRPDVRKGIIVPMMVGLVIGTIFVSIFLAAFHAPTPRDLPIGIVGPDKAVSAVTDGVAGHSDDAIAFTTYDTAANARAAITDRTIYGAYVIADDGQSAKLLYAGANGPAVTGTLEGVFGAVAQYSHATLTTDDVLPTSKGDTRSLSIFYAGFGLVLAGYLFGLVSYQMGPRLPLRFRLISLAAFSIISGLAVTFIAGHTGFNALPGNLAGIATVTILLAAAISAATLLFMRIGGAAGTLIASLILLILGNATGGGTLPVAYLPAWLEPLSHVLPVGLGIRALQGVSYFNNNGFTLGVILLGVWILASVLIIFTLDTIAARRTTPQHHHQPPHAHAA